MSHAEARRARTGFPPLEVEVVPAGSTRAIELQFKSRGVRSGELTLSTYEYAFVPVEAFSADGRYIHGRPPGVALTAGVGDADLVRVTADSDRRALRFEALAPGLTELTVTFDGVTTRFPLRIY